MKKSQWNENEMKSLFSQLPRVTDQRDPQDIYEKVVSTKRVKKPNRWLIASASTAAVCLFAFFASTFLLQDSESSSNKLQDSNEMALNTSNDQPLDNKVSLDIENEKKERMGTENVNESSVDAPVEQKSVPTPSDNGTTSGGAGVSTALLYSDKQNEFITVGVPLTSNDLILPVTVEADSSADEISDVVQQIETALSNEPFGLQFSLVDWKSTLDSIEQSVNVIFSSQEKKIIDERQLDVLEETYRYQPVEKVFLYTDKQKGVTLSSGGTLEEMKIDPTPQRAIYIIQGEQNSESFFVPSNASYNNISEALNEMKIAGPAPELQASIPQDVNWNKILIEEDRLVISFTDDTKLENNDMYEKVIEAILLTAREFGYKTVQFENSHIDTIGSINLHDELVVPIAPNLITS